MKERYEHEVIAGRFVLHKLFKPPGSRYWWARWRDLETDEVRRKSTREVRKPGAKAMIVKWLERLSTEAEISMRRFSEAYEEWLSLKTIRQSSLRDLQKSLAVYQRAGFDSLDVDEVELSHLERFLKDMQDCGRAPRTRRKHLTTLRSFFRWCIRRGYALEDPTEGIKIPKGSPREGKALEVEEARRLIATARQAQVHQMKDRRREWSQRVGAGDYLWLAILVSLHTGLRRANVLGLRWTQVDLQAHKISIPGKEMKSGRNHVVPIHPELLQVLRARLRSQEPEPRAPVLGRKLGEIKLGWKALLRRAGLPEDLRWHDLRHSFASWMATRAPYAVLQQLLGHAPGTVTLGYAHVSWRELEEAIRKMPRLLPKPLSEGKLGKTSEKS